MLKKEKETYMNHESYVYRYSWLKLIRPMTLTGTITPALAGTIIASEHVEIRLSIVFAFLLAALLVQATANMWNDYYDFKNGQDKEKWLRCSDGIYAHTPLHHQIPIVTVVMVSVAIGIGFYLALSSSYLVAIIGAIGIAFGYFYSAGERSLSAKGFGEIVAGVFLGPVVTTLAYMVHGNPIGIQILAISIPFAFLISSMILSNNIRDIDKDRFYRRTQAMILGRVKAAHLLSVLLGMSYIWLIVLIYFHFASAWVLLSLLSLPLAIRLRWSFRRNAPREDEVSGMKWAAWHHWAFGLLFVIGLLLSKI